MTVTWRGWHEVTSLHCHWVAGGSGTTGGPEVTPAEESAIDEHRVIEPIILTRDRHNKSQTHSIMPVNGYIVESLV